MLGFHIGESIAEVSMIVDDHLVADDALQAAAGLQLLNLGHFPCMNPSETAAARAFIWAFTVLMAAVTVATQLAHLVTLAAGLIAIVGEEAFGQRLGH
ncbi:MAG: hypothetical protein ACHQX3_01030 [Nitrospirales bacterium]